MNKKTRTLLIAVLAVVAVVCLAIALGLFGGESEPTPTPTPTPVVTPSPTPEPEPTETGDPDLVDGLPVGAWPITEERKNYVEDSLTLYIPCIGITRAVHDGTDAATLNRGVGLYEYAQLPGEGNRNVSMAGHRNGIDKNGNITPYAPFYYIDQVGDCLLYTSPSPRDA